MKLERKRRLSVLIPIGSFADIAFLLIIFFMLASNLVREARLDYTPPKSPDIEDTEQEPISITVDKDGVVYLQGDECPVAALETMVSQILERRTEKSVLVNIDENITEEQFGPVLLALSKAEAEPVLTGTLASGK